MFLIAYVFILSCFSALSDPAYVLAELLQKKGLLEDREVAALGTAPKEQCLGALVDLLVKKGILSGKEELSGVAAVPSQPVVEARREVAAPPPKETKGEWRAGPGNLTMKIHGSMMFNAFSNLSNVNILDVPLFQNKTNGDALGNDKSFGMTLRQSRIGVTLQGQGIGDSKLLAVIEADFFGGKAALPPGEHMVIPRLRLAYLRLNGKRHSVVVGQDWSVFAPLNPISYAAYSIPAYAGGGNPWIRLPQLRYERRYATGRDGEVSWQFAITDPNLGDHPLGTFLTARTPGVGERGKMPGLENRLQYVHPLLGKSLTVGVSGRYGRGLNATALQGATHRQTVHSWGVSTDFIMPLAPKVLVTGELYTGRALGGYSSSIAQGVLPAGGPGGAGVFSRGGWAQLQYQIWPELSVNFAYGGDAMRARDLRTGDRVFNGGPMVNAVYRIAPNWSTALEWRRLATRWYRAAGADESGEQFNLSVLWTF